jgi:hypothetical protein
MKTPPWIAALFVLTLAGCHPTMSTQSDRSATPPSGDSSITNSLADWPLKFRAHYFDAFNYSTFECRVRYSRYFLDESGVELHISSAVLGDRYPDNMRAGWGPISNFPSPAVVDWRSSDNVVHHAEVDIGDIFKNQLIRHHVPRDEVFNEGNLPPPQIILEVNDRTINVYMRATIWTKHEQKPGNKHSDMRHDLIKVYSHIY